MIKLESLDRAEALRYLGGAKTEPDEKMTSLLNDCEARLLSAAKPGYLYKIISLPCEWLLVGEDIKNHLADCRSAALICATLGAEVDKLIRVSQITDMPRAVVINSLAAVAIEQVCDKIEEKLSAIFPESYFTFRYSPGYGDFPIELQKSFLSELDAPRKIGLSANSSHILTPSKSVTAVIGISSQPIEAKKRGCAVCNLRKTCRYRRNGEHCGF